MTFVVPNSVARLFQLPVKAGEEAVGILRAEGPLALWLAILIAAGAFFFVLAIYGREAPTAPRRLRLMLAGIRIAIVGIVLLMIAQVTLTIERRGQPEIALVLDDSQSMSTADAAAPTAPSTSRFQRLQAFVNASDLLGRLGKAYRLQVRTLTGSLSRAGSDWAGLAEAIAGLEPVGKSSPLGRAVLAALADSSHARVVAIAILTDGVSNDGPNLAEAAEAARQRGVPLFIVGFGGERLTKRLRLSDVTVNSVAFVDEPMIFRCRLVCEGMEGQPIRVDLREKDKPEVLAQVDMAASGRQQPESLQLSYRPKRSGRFNYVLQAHDRSNTPGVESNVVGRSVEVRSEPIRVLLAQSYPSFEFRYLRNVLLREKTIALDTILQEADPELTRQDSSIRTAFPTSRDELSTYDVIIVGDVNPALLSSVTLQNLADYVRQPLRGGSVIFIAGPSYLPWAYFHTPLAELFPFADDKSAVSGENSLPPFVVRPTALGLASPAMQLADTEEENQRLWQGLAPLDWLVELSAVKPGARVLAEHPLSNGPDGRPWPVFCFQYVGSGKVLFHATDETWRWRYRVGDGYFGRYWLQTIRYLCRPHSPADRLRLTVDRQQYRVGEVVHLGLEFADETSAPADDQGVAVMLTRPDGQSQQVRLVRRSLERGLFTGEIRTAMAGTYCVELSTPAGQVAVTPLSFNVIVPDDEMSNVQMDKAEMVRAAERSGGRFYTVDGADRLPDELPQGELSITERLPAWPLWNRWPVLAALLALLGWEWGLRRRHGMA